MTPPCTGPPVKDRVLGPEGTGLCSGPGDLRPCPPRPSDVSVTVMDDLALLPGGPLTRTGRPVAVRDVRVGDERVLTQLLAGLSPTSTYRRFLSGSPASVPSYLATLMSPAETVCALLASVENRVVAVASLHPDRVGSAEFAVAVADEAQGDGIGTLLLEELVCRARGLGLTRLTALVLADNAPMLEVFGELGVVVDLSAAATFETLVASRAATAHAAAESRQDRDAAS